MKTQKEIEVELDKLHGDLGDKMSQGGDGDFALGMVIALEWVIGKRKSVSLYAPGNAAWTIAPQRTDGPNGD